MESVPPGDQKQLQHLSCAEAPRSGSAAGSEIAPSSTRLGRCGRLAPFFLVRGGAAAEYRHLGLQFARLHWMPLLLLIVLSALAEGSAASPVLGTRGTAFTLDGKPFEFTGVSFFNAIYNAEFNRSEEVRREWLRKFRQYGVNVLRIWAQWDNRRGFVDACPECTLYWSDGSLRGEPLARLKEILASAAAEGMVIHLTLFTRESWRDGIRLAEPALERAAAELARELKPWRNLAFQIWNEFSHHTVAVAKAIKATDAERLVTSSPGVAGVLTAGEEETALMDYLTPHTSRQSAGAPWEIAPAEIRYLITRYGKPVVDDEPSRNGTAQFGGPRGATFPEDHIVQIQRVREAGGFVIYHHDMFQTGRGSAAVPPSGIPDPEFSPYHRRVFEFLARGSRYGRR